MTTGIMVQDQNLEKQIEKQMGCMAGFLQLFDRHQILTGKRLCAAPKRLPNSHSPKVDSLPEPEKNAVKSPANNSKLLQKEPQSRTLPSPDRPPAPAAEPKSPAPEAPEKLLLPLRVLELKEGSSRSSWKFKEAPRLSLDSRATVDARGSLYPKQIRTGAANRCDATGDDGDKQRRSPSVIARLMGLEPLANSPGVASPEPARKAELRRSASESRIARDLFQFRLSVDGNATQMNKLQQSNPQESNAAAAAVIQDRARDLINRSSRSVRSEPQISNPQAAAREFSANLQRKPAPPQRKSYFDSADFFPAGQKQTISVYGEIERRLKMRGIEEPSKDLETLKQILEALQLKGLLHSPKKPSDRNFVYDRTFSSPYESPIIVMKPSRSRRVANESPPPRARPRSGPPARRNPTGISPPAASPRRERAEFASRSRSSNCSPTRSDCSAASSLSSSRRKQQQVGTQRKVNETTHQRRVLAGASSPAHSPKLGLRGSGVHQTVTSRSPRMRKPTMEIYPKEDESSSVSESSLSTSSQTDTERWGSSRGEGRSVLERCDKLLHSIAEMTGTELQQPSPVSVLDSSFYKEESSPSPVMKRTIGFRDLAADFEDEAWPPAFSPELLEENSGDSDFVYVAEILRASSCFCDDSDLFLLLEKQQFLRGKDASRASRLRRRLIFDATSEILDRKRQLPPWKLDPAAFCGGRPELQQVWLEFQKLRDVEAAPEDLFEAICGVLKKDLAGDGASGWREQPLETSELVLDIERQVFKDLINEMIQSLATSSAEKLREASPVLPRRKLIF